MGRESSVQLINSLGEDKTIIVVAQREARVDAPQPSDLYTVGTSAVVHKVVKMPNQSLFVFAEGLERVRLGEFTQLAPFMSAHYHRAAGRNRAFRNIRDRSTCSETFSHCFNRSLLDRRRCRTNSRRSR